MEGVEEMTDEELDEYLDEATFEDFDDLDIEDEDEDEDDDEEEYEEDEDVEDDDLEFEGWMNELMDEESMDKFMSSENPDAESASADDMDEEYGEVVYEIELDEASEEEDESVMDEDMDEAEEDEDLEEAARTYGNGKAWGRKGLDKPRSAPLYLKVESENRNLKNQIKLIESELRGYKAKNNEYKSALGSLKEKMNEMAVYYTNLSYTNKLFTEHTTTKKEKLDILRKFDNVKSVNESKNLFKMLSEDLSSKKTISNLNSLSENVEKTLTSSSSKLTESVVYEDPKIKQIKDLMSKLNRK